MTSPCPIINSPISVVPSWELDSCLCFLFLPAKSFIFVGSSHTCEDDSYTKQWASCLGFSYFYKFQHHSSFPMTFDVHREQQIHVDGINHHVTSNVGNTANMSEQEKHFVFVELLWTKICSSTVKRIFWKIMKSFRNLQMWIFVEDVVFGGTTLSIRESRLLFSKFYKQSLAEHTQNLFQLQRHSPLLIIRKPSKKVHQH